jgi:hypothetical protein
MSRSHVSNIVAVSDRSYSRDEEKERAVAVAVPDL